MKSTALPFLLFVGGYLAFEIYGVHSSKHLMEPMRIYGQYVAAQRAASHCGTGDAQTRERFSHNLAVMRRRASQQLAEAEPDLTERDIDTRLDALAATREAEVEALIDGGDCGRGELFALSKTFEQRARLGLQ